MENEGENVVVWIECQERPGLEVAQVLELALDVLELVLAELVFDAEDHRELRMRRHGLHHEDVLRLQQDLAHEELRRPTRRLGRIRIRR